ncbi:hypothetical protein L1987_14875 [Smallanthus sonchifolius]|uniref:Uncharacterized protein n=1 Tax=Smallanthus sonchifolius TaxID=185202 RepID=A0ACB9J620_9ASTR|nr:hypothetical protein L1987_14875 [Smallanthus sonchifolius]
MFCLLVPMTIPFVPDARLQRAPSVPDASCCVPDACAKRKTGASGSESQEEQNLRVSFAEMLVVCEILKEKGNMKSALARKGKNKAASSSTARAKKSRQQPKTEQIPKPNWRNTEALCDQHEVWQRGIVL